LVDGHGAPFLALGSSTWTFVQLSREELDARFDDCVTCDFNAVVLMTLSGGADDTVHPDGARAQFGQPQAYGLFPFTDNKLTPDTAYFEHLLYAVRSANQRGLVVYLSMLYTGHASSQDGFASRVAGCSEAECTAFGQWLGAYFRDEPGIIWVEGGDTLPGDLTKWTAIAEGILDEDPDRLMTGHPNRGAEGADFGAHINLNSVYRAYTAVVDGAHAAGPALKVFYEGTYYGDGTPFSNPDDLTVAEIYTQSYQAILGGCAGANQGDHATWTCGYVTLMSSPPPQLAYPDWEDESLNAAAQSNKWVKKFFDEFNWWELLDAGPDETNDFVTSGIGTGATKVSAAYTSTLGAAIIFGNVTLDLTVFSGAVRIRKYDPSNGNFTELEASEPNTDSSYDVTPGTNAAGDTPWLILVEVL
jgi:hypothetical protein